MTKEGKGAEVRAMFDDLAPRYDLMNRLMTMGRDQAWRRFVVDRAQGSDEQTLLDLASGTGDIAFEMRSRFPQAQVIAADFSLGMLQKGKERKGGDLVEWVACDAMALPFADNMFDAVTFGYLLRNVEHMDTALQEVYRVLKPGGRVVCLDTTPPRNLLAPFVRAYCKYLLPIMGRLVAGTSSSYAYLSESTLAFESPEVIGATFERNGFKKIHWKTFMFHTIAVHWAEK